MLLSVVLFYGIHYFFLLVIFLFFMLISFFFCFICFVMDEQEALLIADKIIEIRAHMYLLYGGYECHPSGISGPAWYDQMERLWHRYCWLLVAMVLMSHRKHEDTTKVKVLEYINFEVEMTVLLIEKEKFLKKS